jgi:hypothetical protein
MKETRGIIMFNRGNGCIVRAIVCFETLRRHWDGPKFARNITLM